MSVADWTHVWWPIVTAEPCDNEICFEGASYEEERTPEQLEARVKPRLRCLGHLPPGDRIERYEDNEATKELLP